MVFVDADTMPLSNIDDLFQYEELSACRDAGWPDCFNTGLFVLKPSLGWYLNKFGGGGKALTMIMTPWNLPHGQWSKKLTMTMTPSFLAMVMVKNGQF